MIIVLSIFCEAAVGKGIFGPPSVTIRKLPWFFNISIKMSPQISVEWLYRMIILDHS